MNKKMTEADYIRGMTDEELANYLYTLESETYKDAKAGGETNLESLEEWYIAYLQHPHGEDF